jgi:hypothetical protein
LHTKHIKSVKAFEEKNEGKTILFVGALVSARDLWNMVADSNLKVIMNGGVDILLQTEDFRSNIDSG